MSNVNNTTSATNIPPNTTETAAKKNRKEQLSEVRMAQLENMSQSVSGMFNTFNSDKNQTGLNLFFEAGASIASLQSINSARVGIENRARTLISEIRMDQLRGVDTTQKREMLENLTGNLQVMNKNLGNSIDRTLAPSSERTANAPSIIDKINADLKKIQEKEEKRVQERYGQREAPKAEETPKPEETAKKDEE